MNREQELNLVTARILKDAPEQRIDFSEPENAFTVWADIHNRMQYCGSRREIDAVWLLAANHVNLKDLYIVKGPLKEFGITRYEKG